jgi:hypothetical protein
MFLGQLRGERVQDAQCAWAIVIERSIEVEQHDRALPAERLDSFEDRLENVLFHNLRCCHEFMRSRDDSHGRAAAKRRWRAKIKGRYHTRGTVRAVHSIVA